MLTITPENLFKLDCKYLKLCSYENLSSNPITINPTSHIQKYCKRDSTQAKTLHIVPSVININEQLLFSLGELITRVHSPIVIVPETKG